YLALSPLPLSIEDLLTLRGDAAYGPEHLIDDLDRMPALVIGTGAGYRPSHHKIREELIQAVSLKAERYQFAASRLGTHLADKGRIVQAYFLLRDAKNPKSRSIVRQAAHEATRSGDQLSSIQILKDMLLAAKGKKSSEERVNDALALAQAYEHSGEIAAAN